MIENLSKELRPGLHESSRRQVQVPLEGELGILLVTAPLLHDDAGGPLGTVIVLDDYTEIVKVQPMAAWREAALRSAHEIKNPLTPIQLSAQRGPEAREPEPPRRRWGGELYRDGRRGLRDRPR